MANLEDTYWWFVGRKKIIRRQLRGILGRRRNHAILNVGCGTGGTVPVLSRFGQVTNVDVSDEAVRHCRERGIEVHKVDGVELPFPDDSFDLIAALDVLEHIEHDDVALREWRRLLKPGGHLILTVPAYRWLWSQHDESLHHHRRYSAAGLHRQLNLAGFIVTKRSYAVVFSFPMIIAYRLWHSLGSGKTARTSYAILPSRLNSFFILLLSIEGVLMRRMNFPFGTSILTISTKT